jgi:hypothetical protein
MVFSCGPTDADLGIVPSTFYKVDKHGCHSYKLNAPLFVRLRDEAGVAKLTRVAGPVVFVANRDEFYGGEGARDYRSKVVEDPTYRSLMGVARASQAKTRDYHHAFVEGIYFKYYEEIDGRRVMILELSLGS